MVAKEKVEAFWKDYIQSLPEGAKAPEGMPEAWGFGDSPEMAEELGRLVKKGIKSLRLMFWMNEPTTPSVISAVIKLLPRIV
jgi:hypothetical protein